MTEEERKEFEEFQKWKEEEKKKKEALIQGETNAPSEDGSLIKEDDSKPKENNASSDRPVAGKQVSSATSILIYMGGVVGVIVILCMFALSTNKNSTSSTDYAAAVDSDYVDSTSMPEEGALAKWQYDTSKDQMRGSTDYSAVLYSDYNEEGGSYDGGNMYIIVRKAKKFGGLDVFLRLTNDQFGGSDYDGNNYVTVKFDNNSLMKFYYDEGADNGTDLAFIRKKSAFLEALKKAKSIRIEARLFSAGTQQFNFHTDHPLKWDH